jgi:cytochrome P450
MQTVSGVGTLLFFARFLRDPLTAARKALKQRGPLIAYRSFLGIPRRDRTTIFAVGAEYNRAVLGDPGTWHTGSVPGGGPKGTALARIGSDHLVSLNGPRHAYYRRLISSPLRTASIDEMGDDIGELVAKAVAGWTPGEADLWPLAQDLMRSVAVALLFSGDQALGRELGDRVRHFCAESKSARVNINKAGFPGRAFSRLMQRAEEIERCALEMAAAKRGHAGGRDLVSLIVNSPDETGAPPTRDAIAGHIPILFASSYETCQTVLSWSLLLLAQHPEVASALAAEIGTALNGATPTLSRVRSLPLLNGVVKESLRLLPPVPYQVRISASPTTLGEHEVPPGTHVLISAFLTNRDDRVFAAPDRFLPERWLGINPSAFEYLSFSGGPRACPGFAFGTSIVKVALAAILSRFRFAMRPGADIDYSVDITLVPKNGLPGILSEADGRWSAAPVRGRLLNLVDFGAARVH